MTYHIRLGLLAYLRQKASKSRGCDTLEDANEQGRAPLCGDGCTGCPTCTKGLTRLRPYKLRWSTDQQVWLRYYPKPVVFKVGRVNVVVRDDAVPDQDKPWLHPGHCDCYGCRRAPAPDRCNDPFCAGGPKRRTSTPLECRCACCGSTSAHCWCYAFGGGTDRNR